MLFANLLDILGEVECMTLENEGRDTKGVLGGGGAIFDFHVSRLTTWHPYLTIKSILWSTIDPNELFHTLNH